MAALAEALPEVGDRPLVACVSILDDKDAAGMLRALLPRCSGAVFTCSPNPRALPPATLASLAGQLGGPPSEIDRDPRARRGSRAGAGRPGRRRAGHRVDLPRRRPAGAIRGAGGRPRCERRGPSVLAMVGLVAVVVALVILVFFAIGYAFGRAFL